MIFIISTANLEIENLMYDKEVCKIKIHEIYVVKAATENMLHGNIVPWTVSKKEGKARMHDSIHQSQ
jgi:hypothetical protein